MQWLIIIYLIIFSAIAIKRIDWSLYFIIVLLPSYLIRFSFLGIPLTLLECMILISFSVWFIKELPNLRNRLNKKEKKKNYPFYREIIALILISFLALFVSGFSVSALGIWKAYFFEPVLFFILVVNLIQFDEVKRGVIISLAVSTLLVAIAAIYQKISGDFIPNEYWAHVDTRRVISWFQYPNAIGLYLAPIIPFLIASFYYLKKDFRNLYLKYLPLIAAFLGLISIIFARSDGALVAVIFSTLLLFILINKKTRAFSIIISIILIVLVSSIGTVRNKVVDRLSFQDLSGQIRLQQWQETMKTFSGSSILLGNGLDNYQESVAPYHQEGIFYNYDNLDNFDAVVWASSTLQKKYWQPVEIYLYPHNIFLNFWTELGLMGLILFIWIFIKSFYQSIKLKIFFQKNSSKKMYLALGLLSAFSAILIHGLVDVPYFKNDLSLMFFLFLALLGVMMIERNDKEK